MARRSRKNTLNDSGESGIYAGVPSYDRLLFPTIRALKALGGSGTIEEIVNKVIELEKYPSSIATAMHVSHSMTALEYRLAWARTYLKRVGALANSERGVWTLTEKGAGFSQEDCDKVPAEVRKQDRANRDRRRAQGADDDVAIEETGDWKEELLATLRKMPAQAFERLSQRILREAGFTKVEVKGKSGDGGIDGIGILRVNLVSFTILFQCKRYKDAVPAGTVRDFRGAMQGRCDKGLDYYDGHLYGGREEGGDERRCARNRFDRWRKSLRIAKAASAWSGSEGCRIDCGQSALV
jgi:restriction system protein